MALSERFYPSKEILNNLNFRDQKRLRVLTIGDLICFSMYFIFGSFLLLIGKLNTGLLMLGICLFFAASLFMSKKGKIVTGSYLTTIGLSTSSLIIAFFTTHVYDPIVCYRTACFCITVSVINYIISHKKNQIYILMIISIINLLSSTFVLYYPNPFAENSKDWISALAINLIAIVGSGLILVASNKSNEDIVSHSEKEHDQVAESLNTITTVLEDVKESINVGQKLNSAVDTASTNISSINQIYTSLVQETNHLNNQVYNVQEASQKVGSSSSTMATGIDEQNRSLEEVSSSISQISANISNIDKIAEKRRAGMAEITELLKTQDELLRKIVGDVEKVQDSSNRIANFVKTVENIAKQTNLLAMNASIEAAHSGINGKGFSVIAQEIRKLSEQTTINANKISETLVTNTVVVEETTESVKNFATATKQSAKEIAETIESMEEILRGVSEIDEGTREIMISVNKVVDVANDNTKMIDDVVQQISGQNDDITSITNDTKSFKEMVASISSMLESISTAIKAVQDSATENEQVSARIADLLK